MVKELTELTQVIFEHEAVNNDFYKFWLSKKLNLKQLAVFVRNYWEWTYQFPKILAELITYVDDVEVRAEYTKILFSEMGSGENKRVHSILFEEFCNQLAIQFQMPDYLRINNLREKYTLLPTTQNLINWQKEIYRQNYSVAAGAQLALEWQAYTMIRKLYDGARNYMSMWSNPDHFHEACEFFYVHIGYAEKEHKEESILAAAKLISDGVRFDDLQFGFMKNLELIAAFWNGIAKEIDKV